MNFIKQLFCSHKWKAYGGGYDDYVKCTKCGYIRDRKPGDISSR